MILRPIQAMAVLGAATLMLAGCGPAARTITKAVGSKAVTTGRALPMRAVVAARPAEAETAGGAREMGRQVGEEAVKHGAEKYIDHLVSGDERD